MASRRNNARQPPSRAAPLRGPRGALPSNPKVKTGTDGSVIARLQQLISEKDDKIEKLTDRINTLSMENRSLQTKIDNLKKNAGGGPPKKKVGGGVSSMLAAKLHGHLATRVKTENKENRPSRTPSPARPQPLPKAPAAAPKKSKPSQGGNEDFSQYAKLFKKYEMMMKIGINVHGAVGRMRQDGCDKAAIAAFERKHNAFPTDDDQPTPQDLGLPVKKEVAVSKGIKMKRLHWDPTNLKHIKGSIWEELDETQIRYDMKHFELHFQTRPRKPIEDDVKRQEVAKGEIITFVPKKRTQGVLIGLKNLNLDNNQLRLALHKMDETIMNVDTLSKLAEIVPTMDEQTEAEKKIMQEGTRNVKNYGTVEQFFFTFCDFYNLQQRLKLWMFKQNFNEICDSLQLQYKTIGKACDKIRNNRNLKLLLTIMLAFGNHMNAGTRKGCTYGFDLKILTELTGVKSFDNTRSLLMYVYEFCDRKYPNALKVLPELMDVLKSASSMEVETLKRAYQRIQDNMREIKNLVTSDEIENYDMDDKFIMVLTKFHKTATPKMKRFNMTVSNVMVSIKRVMKKYSYGTDDEPKTIESFFQIWWKFMQDLSASKEKLMALEKERQKRIAQRKKQKDKEKKKAAHAKYGGNNNNNNNGGKYGNKGGPLPSNPRDIVESSDDEKGGMQSIQGKLSSHVKRRSILIAKGGKSTGGQNQNDTVIVFL